MKIFIIILFLLSSFQAFAQIDWVVYNTSNSGIPHNVVEDITFDASGNIWVATYGGVGKFDGANWTAYTTANSILPSNVCYSIKADADTIWIGSVYGLIKFDGTNWTSYPYGYVVSMAFEENGTKWFGGYQTGLVKYDGSTWTRYDASNSDLTDSTYYSINIDSVNNKWFATPEGVFKFDDIDWTQFTIGNSDIPGNIIVALSIDANDTKWIGVAELGMGQFDDVIWIGYDTLNSGLPSNYVNAEIAFDENGDKWIGTSTKGLAFFDNTTWTTFNMTNSELPSNAVEAVSVDNVGNKWIGTYGEGLAVYRENGVILSNNDIAKSQPAIYVYPNPATNYSTVVTSFKGTYQLQDITGKVLLTGSVTATKFSLDISALSKGIYLLSLFDGEQQVNRKVVKE